MMCSHCVKIKLDTSSGWLEFRTHTRVASAADEFPFRDPNHTIKI